VCYFLVPFLAAPALVELGGFVTHGLSFLKEIPFFFEVV
jgi:hypothetical protein